MLLEEQNAIEELGESQPCFSILFFVIISLITSQQYF
jgi:hypothetical protein